MQKKILKSGLVLSLLSIASFTPSLINAQSKKELSASEITAKDPKFISQSLILINIPKPSGATISLFNGKDLNDWTPWLGYTDPAKTYTRPNEKPIGPAGMGTMFQVKEIEGEPAIFIDGKTWGSLVHKGDYSNYHLRLEYKWSGKRHEPRLDKPENNGLLYHTHGSPGEVWGTWSRAIEFEIMTGSVGMVVPVGDNVKITTTIAKDSRIISPYLRFMLGGKNTDIIGGTNIWNAENSSNQDLPFGAWNVLDLYVVGNNAIHVVNGVPVMEVKNACTLKADKTCIPITHGSIQLQSEGAETYFRNIKLTPIKHLPQIIKSK